MKVKTKLPSILYKKVNGRQLTAVTGTSAVGADNMNNLCLMC